MSHYRYRYKHYVSITFSSASGQMGYVDPAGIVDGFEMDDEVLSVYPKNDRYKCWLKGETTLLISSIHFGNAALAKDDIFLLRLGGELDKRPNDVMVECFPDITLPEPLPLPPRMAFYLSIPIGLSVMLFGKAASDVAPPSPKTEKPCPRCKGTGIEKKSKEGPS